MRKIFLLAAVLLLAIPCAVVRAGGDDPIDIVIGDGGSLGGAPAHYAPALIPISAAYYPSLGSVLLEFRYGLGSVTVTLENQTTGTVTSSVVNAVQGAQLFPISGDTGVYEMTFTLSNGRMYVGSFEIE